MAWKACDLMSLRMEFVSLACVEGSNMAELCRRFGISRKSGYEWLKRYRQGGLPDLADRSRRPRHIRCPTAEVVEQKVVAMRGRHPAWGGRKIRRRLLDLGEDEAITPSASTITAILHRHDLIDPMESSKHAPCRRFERSSPNALWQMDFKGELKMTNGRWCYPLTMLDDHSRYNLCLSACEDQKRLTVQERLTAVFRRYGLPRAMLMDNGTPWSVSHSPGGYTKLTAWLLRLDIQVLNGRPYHPQTQGKEERFHRTLKAELLRGRRIDDLAHCQSLLDPWRVMYNHDRPHEALAMATPASRYQASERSFPEVLPPIEYAPGDHVRKLNPVGQLSYQGRIFKFSEAFAGHPVGLRATLQDGVWDVYFCHHRVGVLDLHESSGRVTLVRLVSARCARSDAADQRVDEGDNL